MFMLGLKILCNTWNMTIEFFCYNFNFLFPQYSNTIDKSIIKKILSLAVISITSSTNFLVKKTLALPKPFYFLSKIAYIMLPFQ